MRLNFICAGRLNVDGFGYHSPIAIARIHTVWRLGSWDCARQHNFNRYKNIVNCLIFFLRLGTQNEDSHEFGSSESANIFADIKRVYLDRESITTLSISVSHSLLLPASHVRLPNK